MKNCPSCKKEVLPEKFGSNKSTKDGKNVYCKECVRLKSQERKEYHAKWREENRTHLNAKSREWVADNKEKRKAASKKYETETMDKEKRSEYLRNRQIEKRESLNEYVNEWRRANPDKVRAIKNRRRAKRIGNGFVKYDAKAIFIRDNYTCFYCGEKAVELDHVVPISGGGSDTPDNVTASCVSCNRRKNTKSVTEFMLPKFKKIENQMKGLI